ncbi:hypothetical protein [Nocardioides iriomotensis]|uniref:DUF4386 family protein n=1 Tax=Nocardioides iriomotensis TaxID=715784 RepID=A0A4Q5J2T8_9ACTN|nr:hypothetical protein [Nocardioides iriomotensis]RYU12008.1 hypothetical protein ETU37_12190 [Nocardioides iriomotensis]
MTTVQTAPPSTTTTATTSSSALSARRAFLVAAPVLAGLFAIVGAYADPGAGVMGQEMWKIYAANPDPLQFKSLGFHWSYAFWIAPALLIAPYVRGRGAWLANVTALVGFVGMTTLPGMLFIDWYDSALGAMYGVDAVQAVQDTMMNEMWGPRVFQLPGLVGFMLSLPLVALTLWRARLVKWWAIVPVVAGILAFMLSNVMWWGCAITTVCFAVFSVILAKATRP